MAFATLQNRLHTASDSGKVSVQSDVVSGLLYCFISAGAYVSMAAAKTAMVGYIGKEHKALEALNGLRREGE